MQVSAWGDLSPGDSILAILPIFHGFGLGVCVNAAFMGGAKSILVPKFTPEDVARLVRKHKPSFLIGVPTLYEALNRSPVFQGADLRCLKASFCGADQLPRTVKERFEALAKKRGGDIGGTAGDRRARRRPRPRGRGHQRIVLRRRAVSRAEPSSFG